MIQYLITEDQLKLLLSAIACTADPELAPVGSEQSLERELVRMLDRQAENMILSNLSKEAAEDLGRLIGEGGSELAVQAFLLREIPNIAELTSQLLKDFHSYFSPPSEADRASVSGKGEFR